MRQQESSYGCSPAVAAAVVVDVSNILSDLPQLRRTHFAAAKDENRFTIGTLVFKVN